MSTVRINGEAIPGLAGEIKHQKELTPEQRRFLRVRWIAENMTDDQVVAAERSAKIPPGSIHLVRNVRRLVADVEKGELKCESVLGLHADRMEDIFTWAVACPEMSDEQKRTVVGWLRRDGHNDLADQVEQAIADGKGA